MKIYIKLIFKTVIINIPPKKNNKKGDDNDDSGLEKIA